MWLFISFLVFGVFILNVTLGAIAETTVLGDVGEMLVLFVATIFFVAAILLPGRNIDRIHSSDTRMRDLHIQKNIFAAALLKIQ